MAFNLRAGRRFAAIAHKDMDALTEQKKLRDLFVGVQQLDVTDQNAFAIQYRRELYQLHDKMADWQTRTAARKAGFHADNQIRYCAGARVLVTMLKSQFQVRVTELEARQAQRAVRMIGNAEKWYAGLSSYHAESLRNQQNRPH